MAEQKEPMFNLEEEVTIKRKPKEEKKIVVPPKKFVVKKVKKKDEAGTIDRGRDNFGEVLRRLDRLEIMVEKLLKSEPVKPQDNEMTLDEHFGVGRSITIGDGGIAGQDVEVENPAIAKERNDEIENQNSLKTITY